MTDTEHTERLHTRTKSTEGMDADTQHNPATWDRRHGEVFVDEAEMARLFCKFQRRPAAALALLIVILSAASAWYVSARVDLLESELTTQRSDVDLANARITEIDDFKEQQGSEQATKIRDLENKVDTIRFSLATLSATNEKLDATLRAVRQDWRDTATRLATETAARNELMQGVNELLHELRQRPGLTSTPGGPP